MLTKFETKSHRVKGKTKRTPFSLHKISVVGIMSVNWT